MKYSMAVLLLFSLFTTSCAEEMEKRSPEPPRPVDLSVSIPDTTIEKSQLHYDNRNSLWTWNQQLYSGYAVTHYPDGGLAEKIGFLNGRKQNQATHWFPDQHLKRIANYHHGKLHGVKKSWSPDGAHVLLSQLNYYLGKAHGEQIFWYPTGELYKKLHLNMGSEEGMQQAFRKNGELYANYEARKGRIFGLKKAALCYGLEEEKIKYRK